MKNKRDRAGLGFQHRKRPVPVQETKKYYFLVSGRWFRAACLSGPWPFASDQLPPDFAKIPKDHPRAGVRASVPGTPEAQEAVLLAQAPQKAEIKRSEAKVEVTYAGEPEFKPIEGPRWPTPSTRPSTCSGWTGILLLLPGGLVHGAGPQGALGGG